MQLSFVLAALTALTGALVRAEKHIIRFENKCGKGTPQLIQGGKVLSTGADFTSNGPFSAGIAYLQTGNCGFNGENCALLEMTLVNPTSPGAGSSTDISLIAPHAFNVETSFSYFGGCDGQGATCDSGTCSSAFFQPNDNQVQVQCETNDVNLLITFCGDATKSSALGNSSGSSAAISSTAIVAPVKSTEAASSHSVTAATSTKVATTTAVASPASSSEAASSSVSEATTSAAATSATASAAPTGSSRCSAGSRRRRRSADASSGSIVAREQGHSMRRHHARNVEAVRGVSI